MYMKYQIIKEKLQPTGVCPHQPTHLPWEMEPDIQQYPLSWEQKYKEINNYWIEK